MKELDVLQALLELEPPWAVVDVSFTPRRREVEIKIGIKAEKSGWFSRPKAAAPDNAKTQVWRHVNMGTWRCLVHVAVPPGQPMDGLPWCGEEGIPFTRAMAQQVANHLFAGFKLQEVCDLLDLEITDLWKFKYSLDHGKAGLSAAKPGAGNKGRAERVAGADSSSGVPSTANKVWEQLLDGSLQIEIRYLSLKLILTKLRVQMEVIEDPDVRALKAQEIYRYFVRNEKMLAHELTQLRAAAA